MLFSLKQPLGLCLYVKITERRLSVRGGCHCRCHCQPRSVTKGQALLSTQRARTWKMHQINRDLDIPSQRTRWEADTRETIIVDWLIWNRQSPSHTHRCKIHSKRCCNGSQSQHRELLPWCHLHNDKIIINEELLPPKNDPPLHPIHSQRQWQWHGGERNGLKFNPPFFFFPSFYIPSVCVREFPGLLECYCDQWQYAPLNPVT